MTATQRIIGISFGNVNAAVTIINKEGKPEIIANADGERLTPSVVGFATGHEVAGTQALGQAIRSPQTTIREFKALLGQKFSSPTVKHHQDNFPVEIKAEGDQPVYYIPKSAMVMAQETEEAANGPKDITISPLTVTSHLLAHLKDTAEQYMGAKVDGCVISIPYAFSKEQREALLKAAELAALRVFQLVHEPVAALLANDSANAATSESKTALVVDVGGYATTCTVVRVCDGIYDHIYHKTSFEVHSDLLTTILRDHFAAEYEKKNGMALNKRALAKLHVAADTTKKMLSQTASGSCFVESLADGLDFQSNILRMKFEMMSRKAWGAWKTPVTETLEGAHVPIASVDEVLFVGGGSRIPKVVSSIKDVFATDDDEEEEAEGSTAGPIFIVPQEPETVTSMGAGFQARHLAGLPAEALSHYQSSNVETQAVPSAVVLQLDQRVVTLVDQGAPLPCSQRRKVQLQSGASLLSFKQRDTLLAEVLISAKEAEAAGHHAVDVLFTIDANGVGHIAVYPDNEAWQKTVTL